MKKTIYKCDIDEVDFCSYDGMCLFVEENRERSFSFCYGPFKDDHDMDTEILTVPKNCPFFGLSKNAKIKVIVEDNDQDILNAKKDRLLEMISDTKMSKKEYDDENELRKE